MDWVLKGGDDEIAAFKFAEDALLFTEMYGHARRRQPLGERRLGVG